MSYTTYTATVFGETVTFLSDPDQFPIRRVRGDWMAETGLLNGRGMLSVRVTPDGKAWSADPLSMLPQGYAMRCERWGDMERIGPSFCPDAGEFDRVGIRPVLCGSAAENA